MCPHTYSKLRSIFEIKKRGKKKKSLIPFEVFTSLLLFSISRWKITLYTYCTIYIHSPLSEQRSGGERVHHDDRRCIKIPGRRSSALHYII